MQRVFAKVAVLPSINMGLIEQPEKLTVSGDGTCVQSHAFPNGHKVNINPNSAEANAVPESNNKADSESYAAVHEGINKADGESSAVPNDRQTNGETKRRFADPLARRLWDSHHERYFFGYMAYFISTYNKTLKLDLPLYCRFAETSSYDGVTFIEALSHFRFLYDDVMDINRIIADCAHDNIATYKLLAAWRISPFIALKPSNAPDRQYRKLQIANDGTPICADGYKMVNCGFDKRRYRIKYRCPLMTGKVKYCPYANNCNKTKYGKTVYVRLADNPRFLTPVPRDSDEWNEVYKQRTATERVNNRILTDYLPEHPKRYGKKKLAFFTFINAINIHLDAQVKHGRQAAELGKIIR